MKLVLLEIIIVSVCLKTHAQRAVFHNDVASFSEMETKKIREPFDTNFAIKRINIFPINIEWRYYPDSTWTRNKYKKADSLFLRKNASNRNYGRVPFLEKLYSNKINAEISRNINPYIQSDITKLNEKDSVFLEQQLDYIKKNLKNQLIQNYSIGDSLADFLRSFPGDQNLFVDVLALHGDLHLAKVPDLYWFLRIIVIDNRSKKIVFYSFKKTESGGGGWYCEKGMCSKLYYLPNERNDFPRTMRGLKPYITYLKTNSNFLLEKSGETR